MNPILTVNRGSPFNKMMFLQASNLNAVLQPIRSIVKAIVVVCGQEKVVAKDKLNMVFNIKGVKSSSSSKLSFKLPGIWEVDTTGLLQTPEDCPI